MRSLACCLFALFSLCNLSLKAQPSAQPSAPASDTFGSSIDVRVVNVEAVVTDAHGDRVSGLTAKDFHLRLDGRETPIESFAEIGEGKPAATAAIAGDSAAPRGRSLVVFIDESLSVKASLGIVLKQIAGQLSQLDPADQVAVVAFNGEHLALLSGWTRDRAALAGVFARAANRPTFGIAIVAARRADAADSAFEAGVQQLLDAVEGPGSDAAAAQQVNPVLGDLLRESLASPLGKMASAITATMRGFASTPGRKLMLLLSGGWPTLSIALPVSAEANRLGYTLYPVDVPGVDTTFVANDAGAAKPRSAPMMKDSWESNAEYTLEVLARATGGKAAIDSARLDALPRALEDSRSYYWLSFSPQWAGDDRSHTLELVVDRPGLKVRSRRSFVDLSAATRASLTSQDSTFLGGDLNAKRLTVLVGPPAAPSRRGQQVPFLLTIPLTEFAAGLEGENAADLVLTVQTEDDGGARTAFHDTPVHVVADPKAPGSIAHFKVTLPLARHPQRLIFTLREAASGTVLWGDAWVTL
jgi:VWFA-related protein